MGCLCVCVCVCVCVWAGGGGREKPFSVGLTAFANVITVGNVLS